jgi:hypothetical protein
MEGVGVMRDNHPVINKIEETIEELKARLSELEADLKRRQELDALRQSGLQRGKTASYWQWKKDLEGGGLRITTIPEPVPCSSCGQPVYKVTFTVGKKPDPEPTEEKPDWKNAIYCQREGTESFTCALCGEEYVGWSWRWTAVGVPGAICNGCHAKVKKEADKPEPKAETCDSCGRVIEGCGYIVGTSHVCSGCKGPIPSPTPNPGDFWIMERKGYDRHPVLVMNHLDGSNVYCCFWKPFEWREKIDLVIEDFLRPATTDEADAFWGR